VFQEALEYDPVNIAWRYASSPSCLFRFEVVDLLQKVSGMPLPEASETFSRDSGSGGLESINRVLQSSLITDPSSF
jgi:hypothetical protein